MAETKDSDGHPGALEEFLRESEAFSVCTLDTIVKSGGDDDAPLIVSQSGAVHEQLAKPTRHVRAE